MSTAGFPPRIRVKICCMATPEEARIAAAAGADMVGLVGPMPSGAGAVSPEACRRIAMAAPAWVSPVLLTAADTAAAIAADVVACGVRAVQIVREVPPAVHGKLAEMLPGVRRLQAIHVETADALETMARYGTAPDAFLLDSGRPGAEEFGGTGRVHDWEIAARIVAAAPRPVILAGGLTPANIGEALARVRPFGVDVCTGVRTGGRDGGRLDAGRLGAFMAAVRAAERHLEHGPEAQA